MANPTGIGGFQKGESGNPGGGRDRKVFVDALHSLISRPWCGKPPELGAGATVAHAMAHRLIKGSFNDGWKPGEALAYLQEICDRAYGKPKQALTGGDEDDKPLIPDKIEIVLKASDAVRDT